MPKLKPGTTIISFSSLLSIIVGIAVQLPAPAQMGGSTEQQQHTGESIDNTSAPTFKIPNFVGDKRQGDAHKYMHKTERDPWNEYRLTLQQVAQQSFKQQPSKESPTPATAGPNQLIQSTMQEAGMANAGLAANSMSGNSADQYAGGYSTNVSGIVQGQPSSQVPGLVGP